MVPNGYGPRDYFYLEGGEISVLFKYPNTGCPSLNFNSKTLRKPNIENTVKEEEIIKRKEQGVIENLDKKLCLRMKVFD